MFQAPKLTDAGKNLYYRNMAGEGIKFTTIQLGNGTISGPISAMTALVSAVVTIDAAVKNNAEQYADVSGHFSNAELEEGFYWREIGVFAADPDYPNDRSHDILYCYQNAYDTADFIPVASVETVEKNITVPIIVGDASTVSCTLSSSQVLVSEADLEAHDKDANAHNALFEKINKELEKKQDTINAKGILKGDQDAKGNPTVTKATPGVDYQQPTQVLTESNAMALTDTVPFFSGADGQNRKVTLKKLKEALGVQSASINVTTCAGAAVVCTDGETTLNGVGSTKFSLPENTGNLGGNRHPERPHGQRRGGGHRRHAVQRGSGDYLQRGSYPRTHENHLQRGGNIRPHRPGGHRHLCRRHHGGRNRRLHVQPHRYGSQHHGGDDQIPAGGRDGYDHPGGHGPGNVQHFRENRTQQNRVLHR